MKRLIKKSFAVLSVAALVLTGCGKEDTQYGNEIGTVDGKINFDGTEPEIALSNIKSYVGEEIDFLSGIEVGNIDENKDMETWVDSSLVDIFTPGDYKATYTIKYDGKEYTKDIVVTIIAKENSGESNAVSKDNSQETTANGNESVPNGNGSQNNTNTPDGNGSQSNTNTPNGNGSQSNTNTPNGNSGQNNTNIPNGNGSQNNTNTSNGNGSQNNTNTSNGNGSQNTTSKPNSGNQSNNKPQPTTKNTNQTTAKRQIVTSSGNATTAYQELGYYSIELLSGKTVKLKGSTSKYIVSTHTDISYVTKNNNKYKVSKLIVNFNDGTSRVLETVEEKVQ
mgnify:CR=1 FL=1